VRELEEWGAVFDRTKDGLISQRNFGGHRYPRLAHVGDRTGLELIRSLQDHGVHQGIDFHMECTALELLLDGARIAGVLAYWRETGRFVVFRCKAVILATGGGGKAWPVTSNSWESTGDRRGGGGGRGGPGHVELVGARGRGAGVGVGGGRGADGHGVHPVPPDRDG